VTDLDRTKAVEDNLSHDHARVPNRDAQEDLGDPNHLLVQQGGSAPVQKGMFVVIVEKKLHLAVLAQLAGGKGADKFDTLVNAHGCCALAASGDACCCGIGCCNNKL
jgi:hypothetical protein